MKASSWFVSLLFWGLATRAAASTQTDYASVREAVVQAGLFLCCFGALLRGQLLQPKPITQVFGKQSCRPMPQQAEEMGHALEVLQTVSGETSDAIRQIKNACGS